MAPCRRSPRRTRAGMVCLFLFFVTFSCFCLPTAHATGEGEPRHDGPHEEEESTENNDQGNDQERAATMSDVWLMMVFAFGWMVAMVAVKVHTDGGMIREYAVDGIVVNGNVLESNVDPTGGELGIPSYHAVIDYIVELDPPVQVRKKFRTRRILEVGFANVEILVLPGDPESGILKEDWEKQYEENDKENTTALWTRYLPFVLGYTMIAILISGALRAVQYLPNRRTQTMGWITVGVGSLFMWPLATKVHAAGQKIVTKVLQSTNCDCRVLDSRHYQSNTAELSAFKAKKTASRHSNKSASPRSSPFLFPSSLSRNDTTSTMEASAPPGYYVHMPASTDASSVSSMSSEPITNHLAINKLNTSHHHNVRDLSSRVSSREAASSSI